MVERSHAALDQTFAALADPTRRAILSRLRRGPATVGQVAAPFAMSLNGISKHVRVLERAGLVRRRVDGREHFLHLRAAPLERVTHFAESYRAFWESRLDALAEHLRETET
ncbi:MAG: metalloregulator ArsR/SmtB family transcription factor [Proteobacteria bacterium]|nr:metalloregulator ArsR/SmtB family transcription factor [Pseudomonadota bacterium]